LNNPTDVSDLPGPDGDARDATRAQVHIGWFATDPKYAVTRVRNWNTFQFLRRARLR